MQTYGRYNAAARESLSSHPIGRAKGNAVIRILVTIVLMAVIFGSPQFAEGTDGPCGALAALVAKHVVSPQGSDAPVVKGTAGALGETVGYKVVAERYPAVPPQLSCTWLFWRATVDSASMTETAREMGSAPPAAPAK